MDNLNQTLNNSLHSTPNDILIGLLPTLPDSSLFSDSNIFWMFTVALFIILYLVLGMFPSIKKSLRVFLSLSIPLLIDLIMSFGSFEFIFPFGLSYTTTHGVMFTKLIDYIFTYGIFTDYSSSLISPFIESASNQTNNPIVHLVVFLSVFIDSFLEFIFITLAVYTLITIIESKLEKQIKYQLPISVFIGLIPVLLYTLFISNPVKETSESIQALNGITEFVITSQLTDIFLAFIFLIINFAIITEIIYLVTEFALSLYIKVNYSRLDLAWTYEMSGVALVYAFVYSFIFFLHSDFKWYIIFPVLLTYAALKGKATTFMRNSNNRFNENQRITDITRKTIDQYKDPDTIRANPQQHDEFSHSNIIISLLLITAFILVFIWYTSH